ncbi:MAG: AsmA family protein [Hyphomicrobiales bacterium]|nr:AsmA family protein [Hyphomicrobiales bacterium]
MRLLIKSVVTLVILAVLAVAALVFLVPTDVVREQVTDLVRQQTGRELAVGGETSFSVFPNVGVKLGDVTLSNPPGMTGGPMLKMQSLTLDLKLMPLVQRRVEVERFVMVRPVFDLLVDRNGRTNWEFRKRAARQPPLRAMRAQAGGGSPGGTSMVQDLRLGTVEMIDGIVRFTDETSGTRHRLDAINVSVALERLSDPLEAEGDLVWRGEKVVFKGRIQSALKMTDGQPTPVALTLSSRHVKGTFDGRLARGAGATVDGKVTGDTPSVRALAAWAGSALPAGRGLGPAKLSGRLKASPTVITFNDARLSLDGMNGQGNAEVTLKKPRPHIRAALALDRLDLNMYLGRGGAAPRPAAAPATPAPAEPKQTAPGVTIVPKGPAPKPRDDQSLTDFIKELNERDGQRQPAVRGWSQTAIDLAALRTVDAVVLLTAGQMFYEDIKVGKSKVTAKLSNGILTADLQDMQLYGGRGTGRLTLNGARAVPAFASTFEFADVSALPLLKDAAKFDWVSGRAKLAVNLTGAGRSQSEIVRTLQGKGSFHFSDGAIEGVNIAQRIRALKKGQLGGWRREPRAKTDFSQLSGTFTMQAGVATNRDLQMVGPLIRLAGAGTVDVPRERLDYRVEPRIVASLEGQGSTQELQGLKVPVKITGPWRKPKIKPDLEHFLKDPDAAVDAAKRIGRAIEKLKKKDGGQGVNRLLQNFLGGGQDGGAPQPAPDGQGGQVQQGQAPPSQEEPQKVRPEDLLRQLFRQ